MNHYLSTLILNSFALLFKHGFKLVQLLHFQVHLFELKVNQHSDQRPNLALLLRRQVLGLDGGGG